MENRDANERRELKRKLRGPIEKPDQSSKNEQRVEQTILMGIFNMQE